jgi:hypothetical protein
LPPLTIARLRRLVRARAYVVSLHAADEMEEDGFGVLDVESVVLTGSILERQRDRVTHEVKVVVRGRALDGRAGCVVAKIGATGRAIILTVYVEE